MFNVSLEGQLVLPNYDIVADVGDQTGTMKEFTGIVSDGDINIDFSHVVENPLINGIEIIQTNPTPPPPPNGDSLISRSLDSSGNVGATTTVDTTTMDWTQVRGAFMVDNWMYYGKPDGTFWKRTFNGSTFGPAIQIDPYDDPLWSNINNGSGGTYRGVVPNFYGQLPNTSSVFYSNGRIYYTLVGQTGMYYRYFSPDQGGTDAASKYGDVIGSDQFTVNDGGMDWSNIAGAFVTGNTLYYVTKSDGVLHDIAWATDHATGTSTVVDSTNNWDSHGLFIGPTPPPNQPPVARASVSCPDLTCTFDGTASSDPDGHVTGYAWDFGDGNNGSGPSPAHTYAQEGTYTYTLTVTDNQGGTDQTTGSVHVSDPATSSISYVAAAGAQSSTKTPAVTVPAAAQSGDLLLMVANLSSSTVTVSDPTGVTGWTLLGTSDANGLKSYLWEKNASAGDAGTKVTATAANGVSVAVAPPSSRRRRRREAGHRSGRARTGRPHGSSLGCPCSGCVRECQQRRPYQWPPLLTRTGLVDRLEVVVCDVVTDVATEARPRQSRSCGSGNRRALVRSRRP